MKKGQQEQDDRWEEKQESPLCCCFFFVLLLLNFSASAATAFRLNFYTTSTFDRSPNKHQKFDIRYKIYIILQDVLHLGVSTALLSALKEILRKKIIILRPFCSGPLRRT